ncbi:SAM-dependent methyltransferase [Flavobacterium sp. ASW18X]|uniref:SAM-dependent methyltransferase n=1 Tax=Flavobacterium sp. ASW18X TaxID=2572595 RepID=UPI0010AE982F|nr:SAM-dependent methyltransferase [Flavobacterium sp. ASW18X]TKD65825.1 SAM-dependent methyltransferase [Flavobacterium sp. ASW18X]
MNTTSPQGILYMIPTMLGDTAPLEVLPLSIKQTIENIDFYIAENEKTARRFIKRISPSKSQPSLHFQLLNKYTDPLEIPSFLDPCLEGTSVGLLSEAGCPGIADPGADVVKIAHEKGIQVVPLVGPSSILLALMASGMNGQSFAFNGYLPIDGAERGKALKKFEKLSKDIQQSQVFIETPYRNDKLFQEMLKKLHPETRLCIGIDITLPTEYIVTKTIQEWKKTSLDLQKRPAVFIIHSF